MVTVCWSNCVVALEVHYKKTYHVQSIICVVTVLPAVVNTDYTITVQALYSHCA